MTGTFEGAALATGAGGMTATPMQMIAAFGAIAADGVYHAPTLDRGGSAGERILSADTASKVMALLETVVTDERGTGVLARVDGIHVAGKTGTTDWTGADGRERTYASFIGVADLPSRRIVALVGIGADEMSGPEAAAPAFARLVKRLRGADRPRYAVAGSRSPDPLNPRGHVLVPRRAHEGVAVLGRRQLVGSDAVVTPRPPRSRGKSAPSRWAATRGRAAWRRRHPRA